MAVTYEHKAHSADHKRGAAMLRTVFASIGEALVAYGEARARTHEVERLMSMSDAQLEKIGLRREDIGRYVYRDQLYL